MTTTATNTVIVAAIVAALALVAIALFTYQGVQATREVACWAEFNTRLTVVSERLMWPATKCEALGGVD
jgi:hypothetical protein